MSSGPMIRIQRPSSSPRASTQPMRQISPIRRTTNTQWITVPSTTNSCSYIVRPANPIVTTANKIPKLSAITTMQGSRKILPAPSPPIIRLSGSVNKVIHGGNTAASSGTIGIRGVLPLMKTVVTPINNGNRPAITTNTLIAPAHVNSTLLTSTVHCKGTSIHGSSVSMSQNTTHSVGPQTNCTIEGVLNLKKEVCQATVMDLTKEKELLSENDNQNSNKVYTVPPRKESPLVSTGTRVSSTLPTTPVILHTPKLIGSCISSVPGANTVGKRPLITLTVPKVPSSAANVMKKGVRKKEVIVVSGGSSHSTLVTPKGSAAEIQTPDSLVEMTVAAPIPSTKPSVSFVSTSVTKPKIVPIAVTSPSLSSASTLTPSSTPLLTVPCLLPSSLQSSNIQKIVSIPSLALSSSVATESLLPSAVSNIVPIHTTADSTLSQPTSSVLSASSAKLLSNSSHSVSSPSVSMDLFVQSHSSKSQVDCSSASADHDGIQASYSSENTSLLDCSEKLDTNDEVSIKNSELSSIMVPSEVSQSSSTSSSCSSSEQCYTLSIAEDECISVITSSGDYHSEAIVPGNTDISSIINQVLDVTDASNVTDSSHKSSVSANIAAIVNADVGFIASEKNNGKQETNIKSSVQKSHAGVSEASRNNKKVEQLPDISNEIVNQRTDEEEVRNQSCAVDEDVKGSYECQLQLADLVKAGEKESFEVNHRNDLVSVKVECSDLIESSKLSEIDDEVAVCDMKEPNEDEPGSLRCLEVFTDALSSADDESPPKHTDNSIKSSHPGGSNKLKFKLNQFNILELEDDDSCDNDMKKTEDDDSAFDTPKRKRSNFDNSETLKEIKKFKPCFLDLLSKCGGPDYRENSPLNSREEQETIQQEMTNSKLNPGKSVSRSIQKDNLNDVEEDCVETATIKTKIMFDSAENPSDYKCSKSTSYAKSHEFEVIDLCESQDNGLINEEDNPNESASEEQILKDADNHTLWQDHSSSFSWVKYLESCQKKDKECKAAPLKLWSEPFPTTKNMFQPGMKLEAVDPQHQSFICVMSVADVMGYRIKLHFDGYSDVHDFWINADSPYIFPVGFAEKNNKTLLPPPGTVRFTWQGYLEHCKNIAAPKQAFKLTNTDGGSQHNVVKIGMKLEAEDRKNGWVCVATVKDIMKGKLLIHFDGWDCAYDFWTAIGSPYLHAVGWCSSNNITLFPPKDYPNPETFSWYEYLTETNSEAVPARIFKKRRPKGFKSNMKVEVVDKRNPMLIRVATIAGVLDYQIKIHFDGWDELYDYWIDDDSPDVHPPTWCKKTGHPLQPPLTASPDDMEAINACGIVGCKGYGHIKGPIFSTHHNAFGCPYSEQNLHKEPDYLIPERIVNDVDKRTRKNPSRSVLLDLGSHLQDDEDNLKKRVRKRRRFFDEICSSDSKGKKSADDIKLCDTNDDSGLPDNTEACTNQKKAKEKDAVVARSAEELSVDTQVHQSVFCTAGTVPLVHPVHNWSHMKHLFKPLERVDRESVLMWSPDQVEYELKKMPGCGDDTLAFASHAIDGEALLLLTQDDLTRGLKLKLGHALKIMAFINSVNKL